MSILEKTDEELLAIAEPMWADLVKYSNEGNYGAFTRNFSSSFIAGANEVEMGKQFARSELADSLDDRLDHVGLGRGEALACGDPGDPGIDAQGEQLVAGRGGIGGHRQFPWLIAAFPIAGHNGRQERYASAGTGCGGSRARGTYA